MKILLGLTTLGVTLWVVCLVQHDLSTKRFPRPASAHTAPNRTGKQPPVYPTVGDDVRLQDPDGFRAVFVYTSEAALVAWKKAAQADDQYGKNAILDSGQVLACAKEERARVIDLGAWASDHAKVRVLAGKHKGRAVWVTMAQMKRISREK